MSSSSISIPTPSPRRPSLRDYEILKVIGHGYSGRVYLALDRISREPVALKVVQKGQGNDYRTVLEQQIQRDLFGCIFVNPLLASWHDANNFYLVSPYRGGHDLAINLTAEGRFKEDRVRSYSAELLVALEEMKARRILHRDIKPANIVFTPQGHIRLIDFGFATKLKVSPVTQFNFDVDPDACSGSFKITDPDYTSADRVGTPPYMSADQHIGRPYSYEADLHGLGVTIYQMLTGRLPFGEDAKSREEVYEAVLCEQLSFRPDDKVSPEARDLLETLLKRDYRHPAQLKEIMDHPWFAGVRWERIRSQAVSPTWKPYISPLPKSTTTCVIDEGEHWLPDRYPDFNYVSPELVSLRAPRGDESILSRLAKIFSRDQSSPPSSPLSSSSLFFSTAFSPPSTSPVPLLFPVTSASPVEVQVEVASPSPSSVPSSVPSSPSSVPSSPSSATSSASPSEVAMKLSPPSLPTAPASISSASPTMFSKNPPPSSPPSITLPSHPTEMAPAPSSSRPLEVHSSAARGDLPPLHIRQQLATRVRPPPKVLPMRDGMTPTVLITPADDDIEEPPSDAPPAVRLPFGDISNQRMLSPLDAERPAVQPVLKPGPRIKLSAPPKRAKRAQKENVPPPQPLSSSQPKAKAARTPPTAQGNQKENVPPQPLSAAQPKAKVARAPPAARKENVPPRFMPLTDPKGKVTSTPPTAVFMIPPKVIPLPLVTAASKPLQTPSKAAAKPKTVPKSPPKTSTPKARPAFKVHVKVPEPKALQSLSRRRDSIAKPLMSPVSPSPVNRTNSKKGVFPKPMIRAESMVHPALAFADVTAKPADYPRPPDSASQPRKPAPVKPLSVEEAFARPPASPPRPQATKKKVTLATTFTSTPDACGVLTLSSTALSKGSLAGFYGISTPRINLDPHNLKERNIEIIERARTSVKDMQEGPHLSARTPSPPIKVGPHYADYLPGPSPTGIIGGLRRLWIRLSMAVSRALSWFRYRGEPDFDQF